MSEQRLASIEQAQARTNALLEALSEKVDDRIDKTDDKMSRLGRVVWGDNGKSDAPGLIVRLDRLEQVQHRTRWWFRTVLASLIGLAVLEFFG